RGTALAGSPFASAPGRSRRRYASCPGVGRLFSSTREARMKVVLYFRNKEVSWTVGDDELRAVQARYPQVEFVRVTEEFDLPAGLADADVFFGFSLRSDGRPVVDAPNRRSGADTPFCAYLPTFQLRATRHEPRGPALTHLPSGGLPFERRLS